MAMKWYCVMGSAKYKWSLLCPYNIHTYIVKHRAHNITVSNDSYFRFNDDKNMKCIILTIITGQLCLLIAHSSIYCRKITGRLCAIFDTHTTEYTLIYPIYTSYIQCIKQLCILMTMMWWFNVQTKEYDLGLWNTLWFAHIIDSTTVMETKIQLSWFWYEATDITLRNNHLRHTTSENMTTVAKVDIHNHLTITQLHVSYLTSPQ